MTVDDRFIEFLKHLDEKVAEGPLENREARYLSLSQIERELFDINCLNFECVCGGLGSYFANSAGTHWKATRDALKRVGPLSVSENDEFVTREGWGDRVAIRRVADAVWEMLSKPAANQTLALAEAVERHTPHADSFDSLAAVLAQDACICLDGALKALEGRCEPELVEYAIEALRAAVTNEKTGYLDLGDRPDSKAVEAEVDSDPRISRELSAQKADLKELESTPESPEL